MTRLVTSPKGLRRICGRGGFKRLISANDVAKVKLFPRLSFEILVNP
jgi:hypothetical protein